MPTNYYKHYGHSGGDGIMCSDWLSQMIPGSRRAGYPDGQPPTEQLGWKCEKGHIPPRWSEFLLPEVSKGMLGSRMAGILYKASGLWDKPTSSLRLIIAKPWSLFWNIPQCLVYDDTIFSTPFLIRARNEIIHDDLLSGSSSMADHPTELKSELVPLHETVPQDMYHY